MQKIWFWIITQQLFPISMGICIFFWLYFNLSNFFECSVLVHDLDLDETSVSSVVKTLSSDIK